MPPIQMDRRSDGYLDGYGHTDLSYTFPEDSRVYLLFLLQSGVLIIVTNALMDMTYVRRRWRLGLLFSRLAGLISSVLFMAWPQPFFFLGLGFAFNFGFCDPRLHLASIRRASDHMLFRLVDVVASCGHHTGASQITGIVLTQVCIGHSLAKPGSGGTSSAVNIFNLNVFLLGAFCAEVIDWGVDCAVLLRMAPHWFHLVQPAMMSIQAACFLAVVLLVKTPVPKFLLFATALANILLVIRMSVMGHKASTNEHFPADDEADQGRRNTIARHLHAVKLLSRGNYNTGLAPLSARSESSCLCSDDMELHQLDAEPSNSEARLLSAAESQGDVCIRSRSHGSQGQLPSASEDMLEHLLHELLDSRRTSTRETLHCQQIPPTRGEHVGELDTNYRASNYIPPSARYPAKTLEGAGNHSSEQLDV